VISIITTGTLFVFTLVSFDQSYTVMAQQQLQERQPQPQPQPNGIIAKNLFCIKTIITWWDIGLYDQINKMILTPLCSLNQMDLDLIFVYGF
jgi:hypothetical protein